jgi:predicted DsbA family dithiol-disulfide isomerase
METQPLVIVPGTPALELDLIADLVCPWSYLGKRSLERALESLYGVNGPLLRWHGLPLAGEGRVSWQQHFASRLPRGTGVESAQRNLRRSGKELGINFDFDRLKGLPDTREAHRLVHIAAREGHQSEVIDAIFQAFFEHDRDIADPLVLRDIAQECQLEAASSAAFADPGEARGDIAAEERRMRSLGIAQVPNLLINGRVLVPGPADVSTYVQALDQALFPELRDKQRLH